MLFKFSSVLFFSTYHDCKRRTEVLVLFFVLSGYMSSLEVSRDYESLGSIYFFFCICDNRPWHFSRCCFAVLLSRTFACHFLRRVHRVFLLSRCRERKRFFMPLQELVVQLKARENLRLTLKNAFVCFWLLER